MKSPSLIGLACAALAVLLSGCATNALDAQWSNSQQPPVSLKGARVLVLCEANEPVVRQICQDKLATELTALGVVPVKASAPLPADAADRQAAAGRAAGAKAVFSVSVVPDPTESSSSGVSVGFGLGGFGFGHGSFGGVGVTAPLGEGRIRYGYAGNGSLVDVDSGTLLWTAKTRSRSVDNVDVQLEYLTRSLATGAHNAGRL